MLAGIASRLADELACGPSDAGLDLCVHFRRPLDEQKVSAALARGIEVRPLSYYASPFAVLRHARWRRDCCSALPRSE
ncbi:hypothetical protein LP419_15315 [Massilia sp. H-1]|nr:hypothetical protein LP419_15315 [Massilia sp. H-1]